MHRMSSHKLLLGCGLKHIAHNGRRFWRTEAAQTHVGATQPCRSQFCTGVQLRLILFPAPTHLLNHELSTEL